MLLIFLSHFVIFLLNTVYLLDSIAFSNPECKRGWWALHSARGISKAASRLGAGGVTLRQKETPGDEGILAPRRRLPRG